MPDMLLLFYGGFPDAQELLNPFSLSFVSLLLVKSLCIREMVCRSTTFFKCWPHVVFRTAPLTQAMGLMLTRGISLFLAYRQSAPSTSLLFLYLKICNQLRGLYIHISVLRRYLNLYFTVSVVCTGQWRIAYTEWSYSCILLDKCQSFFEGNFCYFFPTELLF